MPNILQRVANRELYRPPIAPGNAGGGFLGGLGRFARGFGREIVANTPAEILGGVVNPGRGIIGGLRNAWQGSGVRQRQLESRGELGPIPPELAARETRAREQAMGISQPSGPSYVPRPPSDLDMSDQELAALDAAAREMGRGALERAEQRRSVERSSSGGGSSVRGTAQRGATLRGAATQSGAAFNASLAAHLAALYRPRNIEK